MFSRSRCSSYSVRARSMEGSMSSSSSGPECREGVRVHSSIRAIRLVTVSAASVCRRLVADLLEHRCEERDRLVQKTDRLRVQRDTSHAQAVEDVLEVMRQLARRVEAEHARQALEGVGRAEQPIDQLRVDAPSWTLPDPQAGSDPLASARGSPRTRRRTPGAPWTATRISSAAPPRTTRPAGGTATDRGRSAGDHRARTASRGTRRRRG